MFLALYFATEEERPGVVCNDNEPVLADGWYFAALDRLAKNKTPFDHAHAAALASGPLG